IHWVDHAGPAPRGREEFAVRVALIDPSLFTLPYDAALAEGLRALGHDVAISARPLAADERMAEVRGVIPAFYRRLSSNSVAALPRPAFLLAKGLSHVTGAASLALSLNRSPPGIVHFQW